MLYTNSFILPHFFIVASVYIVLLGANVIMIYKLAVISCGWRNFSLRIFVPCDPMVDLKLYVGRLLIFQ